MFSFFKKHKLTDEEVISSIINWNHDNFEIIVDRYWDKIFRYIFYYFKFSKQVTEDLVQEVFLHLWNNLSKFDTTKKFEPWFYRVIHNYCIDWIKTNSKDNQVQCIDESTQMDISIIKSIDTKIKQEMIVKLLDILEEETKKALLLYYFEQKSYEDISQILDIPKNTIGTIISRWKKKLKEYIETNNLKEILEIDY